MSFYTSVQRYGNNILFRGYDNKGNRIHKKFKFSPTFYLPSNNQECDWTALDGTPVKPIQLDTMSEAKEFLEKYSDVDNFNIYGNTNYVAQFIQEAYPGEIEFNSNFIHVGNFDIEVASDEGFPHPESASYPVISIAYKNSVNNIYYVWGLGDYDANKTELDLKDHMIRYVKCRSEAELLQKFVVFWENNTPDIITGWNIRLFDIPYLVNRIAKVCGEKTQKALSPWGVVKYRQISVKGKSLDAYEIYGVAQMDYYDLFQKFGYTYGNQESYALDHIAHVVLGEKKLSYEEHGNLFNLLTSKSRKIEVDNTKSKEKMAAFEKWCLLRDNIGKKLGK